MGMRLWVFSVAIVAAGSVYADVTDEQTFSYKLSEGGRFSLENINGDVTVIGTAGNQVEIVAHKKAGSQDYLDGIQINIDHSADVIRVETEHPDKGIKGMFNWGDSSGSVTYTVHLPASANLETIESVNGAIDISGVSGVVSASTVNGSIKATDLVSDGLFDTVNGAVTAEFMEFSGMQKATLETVNGRLTVVLPSHASASVNAETINGGIDAADFGLKADKGFIGRDLNGSIGNGSARLTLDTVNGSIKIRSR